MMSLACYQSRNRISYVMEILACRFTRWMKKRTLLYHWVWDTNKVVLTIAPYIVENFAAWSATATMIAELLGTEPKQGAI